MTELDIAAVREQFPALARSLDGTPFAYLDGPAGSQVPSVVVEAVSRQLGHSNANTHGAFVTSHENDAMLADAGAAVADFLGSDDPDLVAFGPNMTTLTFALSRALAQTWKAGDEVIVTRLDHDANVTPWVLAARDAGATVHHIPFHHSDTTLDLDALRASLSGRTKLVAVGAASNATGTINPVAEIAALAHGVGAELFVDAVHYAPHRLIDVAAWDCDYLTCSAYKFFGPHVGMLWGKRAPMSTLPAYRVRPADDTPPHRWMTGTQNHEGIAGTRAAIDYLATVSPGAATTRREKLASSMAAIARYEHELLVMLVRGLRQIPAVRIYGITDEARFDQRAPTVSFTHTLHPARVIAEHLGKRGIFVWDGNYYALEVTESLGLEPEGMVRVGLLHYNTESEVARLLDGLRELEDNP